MYIQYHKHLKNELSLKNDYIFGIIFTVNKWKHLINIHIRNIDKMIMKCIFIIGYYNSSTGNILNAPTIQNKMEYRE